MSRKPIHFLWREHARLDADIHSEARRSIPDEVRIARLNRLKLALKDQIAAWSEDLDGDRVA